MFSGQAWHWIAPDVRYVAARAALEDGGALAVFWNVPDWCASDLREELGEVYRRHGRDGDTDDPMNPRTRSGDEDWATEIAGASGFDAAEVRRYPWHTRLHDRRVSRPARYPLRLPGARSARAGAAADRHRRRDRRPGRSFRMHFVTRLCLARAS